MLRTFLVCLFCLSFLTTNSLAVAQPRRGKTHESATGGTRKHLSTIVFSGLAGAILGLSTLSFYGRPQDKLSNIALGFAIGVITGTVYSTYKAATEPRDFYGLLEPEQVLEPKSVIPELWASDTEIRPRLSRDEQAPSLAFTFTF